MKLMGIRIKLGVFLEEYKSYWVEFIEEENDGIEVGLQIMMVVLGFGKEFGFSFKCDWKLLDGFKRRKI